jgi:putative PEP-CTERM system TPR-repeat lipoprotein
LQPHIVRSYLLGVKGDQAGAQAEVRQAAKIAPGSLAVLYAQAIVDYNSGRHKQALEGLQTVLSKSPQHMPSVLLSGAVQLALGALPQAQQDLERYLEDAPDNRYARKLLATALLRQGQGEQALARLAPLLKDDHDIEALTLAGKAYVASGQFDAASAVFARAAAANPNSPALRTALGMSRMSQGQEAAALADMDAAARMEKADTAARLALATSLLQTRHYDKALAALEQLEQATPKDPVLQLLRGGAYQGKQNDAQARASYDKALSLQADYFPAVAALARMDAQAGKLDAAQRRLSDFAAAQPKQVAPLTLLADLARARGAGDQALQWARKAAAVQPDAPATTVALGRELLANGQQAEALTLLRKAHAAQPANEEILDVLAQAQLAGGDAPAALESYSKLTGLAPRNPLAHARLASAYLATRNESAAEDSLKKAVALMPTYVPAQLQLSTLYMRQNKLDKALAVARQLQRQPDNAAAGYSMEGDLLSATQPQPALAAYERAFALQPTTRLMIRQHILLSQAGRRATADERMARWLQGRPADVEAAHYLAESALFYKEYGAAVRQLRVVLAQQPRDVAALNNLAYAYQQQQDPQARATAEQALQLDGRNPAVLDTLGWILLQEGKHERGVQLLKQAVTQSPDAPSYRYHLAYGLFQAGDRGQARKELDQALSSKLPFAQRQQALDLRKKLDGAPGTA